MENLKDILNSKYVDGGLVASEDMALSLDILDTQNSDMLDFIRKKFHLTCKAYGKLSIDMPYTWSNINNLKKELNHIKKLGIVAKSTVKASHCKIINNSLTPTKKEVLKSIKIINSYEEALENKNVQTLNNGRYLELPSFISAQKIIKRHQDFVEYYKASKIKRDNKI